LAGAINTVLWNETAGTYYAGYYDLAMPPKKAPDYRPLKLKVENNLIEPSASRRACSRWIKESFRQIAVRKRDANI
jgi:hypothetical protein